MGLDTAIAMLTAARKRLKPEQGLIARAKARKAFMRALSKARRILDAEFPLIKKPKPTKPVVNRPVKVPLFPKLNFTVKFAPEVAALFASLIYAMEDRPGQFGLVFGNYLPPSKESGSSHAAFIDREWPDRKQWQVLIHYLARYGDGAWCVRLDQVRLWWHKFWNQPLPCSDLELMAEHQEFLERRKKWPSQRPNP